MRDKQTNDEHCQWKLDAEFRNRATHPMEAGGGILQIKLNQIRIVMSNYTPPWVQ